MGQTAHHHTYKQPQEGLHCNVQLKAHRHGLVCTFAAIRVVPADVAHVAGNIAECLAPAA
jgi:hypothetical protein